MNCDRSLRRVPVYILAAAITLALVSCDDSSSRSRSATPQTSSGTAAPAPSAVAAPKPPGASDKPARKDGVAAALKQLLAPDGPTRKDGIAVAILVDTSGSMADSVGVADGSRRPKIDIARRAVGKVVKQAEGFAKEQSGMPVLLGIYEFSGTTCRKVLPMQAPDFVAAEGALRTLKPTGGTPIGVAIIQAKRDLDAAGLTRNHILVVTDGENNHGLSPGDVVAAIGQLPEAQRPGVYFVAFDVAAAVFKPALDAGAAVLPAADERQLQAALDELVGGKILLEK